MRNSLAEAALTGAINAELLNQGDNANKYVAWVNKEGLTPLHMMALNCKTIGSYQK